MGRSMAVLAATLLAIGCGAFDWNGPGTRCAVATGNGQTWCVTKDAQNNITYSGPVGPPPPGGYDPIGYYRAFREAQRPEVYCTPTGDLGAMHCR
jgi:hypothetical protein